LRLAFVEAASHPPASPPAAGQDAAPPAAAAAPGEQSAPAASAAAPDQRRSTRGRGFKEEVHQKILRRRISRLWGAHAPPRVTVGAPADRSLRVIFYTRRNIQPKMERRAEIRGPFPFTAGAEDKTVAADWSCRLDR
jgi:hypothetical protein